MKKIVTLEGASYPLRFNYEAICRVEELYGLNVLAKETWEPSPSIVSRLLWAALLHLGNDKLTVQYIQKHLSMEQYRETAKDVYLALADVLPKKEQQDADATAT
jgi:hypothetical protein